jgi:hypothetical protein
MPVPLSWTDPSDRLRAVFGLVRRVHQAARLAGHLRLLQLLLGLCVAGRVHFRPCLLPLWPRPPSHRVTVTLDTGPLARRYPGGVHTRL